MSTIMLGKPHQQVVAVFEPFDVLNLVIQTSANIIKTCMDNPYANKRLDKGANEILTARLRGADHYFHFLLGSQVELVHAFMAMAIDNRDGKQFITAETAVVILIVDAMRSYQNWLIESGDYEGPNWADLNEQFLGLFKFYE